MIENTRLPQDLSYMVGSERKDFAVKAGRAQPRKKSLSIILFGTFWTAFTGIFVVVFWVRYSLEKKFTLNRTEYLPLQVLII